ncbi:hypothetical protein QYE76_036774 [Lolium multiflorum]|uniref:Ubiquitin-like domain-containing protein n=1 Tax=Lolium multiflorum TaxID=4521 RepID=A0AAD8VPN6_LOLMU|nr:hypothetical protein QYE76_036774 [Lolium multiflorum]
MAAQVNEEEKETKKMTVFVTVPRPRRPGYGPGALKVVALEVSSDDTVASVKATLHDMEGIPPSRQRLVFASSALPDDDDTTLAEHGVVHSATIQLVETEMRVFVKRLDRSSIMTISGVESSDTVESFRVKVQEQDGIGAKQRQGGVGIRPARQRLLCGQRRAGKIRGPASIKFGALQKIGPCADAQLALLPARACCGGTQMEDGHTLAAYDVRNEITMTLLVRWIVNYRTRPVELDMDVTDTVGRIKERVEEAEGVPVECQGLLLGAEELDDDRTLPHLFFETGTFVKIQCERQERGAATNTTTKGKGEEPVIGKETVKRRAYGDVTGPAWKKNKMIPAQQWRRFTFHLLGPELAEICPSSCDTDPVY